MLPLLRLAIPFLLFPAVSAMAFRLLPAVLRIRAFALINVLGAFGLCVLTPMSGLHLWQLKSYLMVAIPVFLLYFSIVLIHFVLMRKLAWRHGWIPWLAFLFPILAMLIVKYVPGVSEPLRAPLAVIGKKQAVEFFIGISYMAFRLSHMVMEVRNGVVLPPTFSEYLSFAFFVPTLAVGPINPYSVFSQSLHKPRPVDTPVGRSWFRIVVGITKYLFLASLLEQLSYAGLLFDGHPHPWVDLPLAAVAFYLYLYLNFSGYCDMAIGTAGLLGIRVLENFDRPFQARNIQDFWNRWHITLSIYMRDMVFSPVSMALSRKWGPKNAPHAIAVTSLLVFLLIGAWHGLTWNFVVFGLLHGIAMVSCHYYTIWLKKRLKKKGYIEYMENPWIRRVAVAVMFSYASATLFFFANTFAKQREIFQILR